MLRNTCASTFHKILICQPTLSPLQKVNEAVRIFDLSVVVPEFKLACVAVHMICTHMMIDTDDTAFQQAPEVFNVLCVHSASNVFLFEVTNTLMVIRDVQPVVSSPFIGHYVRTLRDVLLNQTLQEIGRA